MTPAVTGPSMPASTRRPRRPRDGPILLLGDARGGGFPHSRGASSGTWWHPGTYVRNPAFFVGLRLFRGSARFAAMNQTFTDARLARRTTANTRHRLWSWRRGIVGLLARAPFSTSAACELGAQMAGVLRASAPARDGTSPSVLVASEAAAARPEIRTVLTLSGVESASGRV